MLSLVFSLAVAPDPSDYTISRANVRTSFVAMQIGILWKLKRKARESKTTNSSADSDQSNQAMPDPKYLLIAEALLRFYQYTFTDIDRKVQQAKSKNAESYISHNAHKWHFNKYSILSSLSF